MASKRYKGVTYDKINRRYQARGYITYPNGIRKRASFYGKTAREAAEKRDLAIAEAISPNGNPVMISTITLGQYLTKWVESAKKIRESTRSGYKGEINKYIVPNIGKVKLSCLTHQDIQNMINKVQYEGASVRTTQILRNILSRALKSAEGQNLVRHNIMHYVELDTYHPKERKVWSEDEGRAFKEAIRNHKYRFFFQLYMTYGLRRGEAIPLTWEDIDFEQKTISITKQYTYHGRKLVVCPPKTDKSIRTLPMLPHIEAMLLELKEKNNSPVSNLVVSDNGKLVKPSSINYEFERIIKQNKLSPVVLHSLRHFVATELKNNNATAKDAQEILGHSSIFTTLQYYQHSDMGNKRGALMKYVEKMQF